MTEYFQDDAGQWRFRVKGLNGEIVATSEGYDSRRNAVRGLDTLRRLLGGPTASTVVGVKQVPGE